MSRPPVRSAIPPVPPAAHRVARPLARQLGRTLAVAAAVPTVAATVAAGALLARADRRHAAERLGQAAAAVCGAVDARTGAPADLGALGRVAGALAGGGETTLEIRDAHGVAHVAVHVTDGEDAPRAVPVEAPDAAAGWAPPAPPDDAPRGPGGRVARRGATGARALGGRGSHRRAGRAALHLAARRTPPPAWPGDPAADPTDAPTADPAAEFAGRIAAALPVAAPRVTVHDDAGALRAGCRTSAGWTVVLRRPGGTPWALGGAAAFPALLLGAALAGAAALAAPRVARRLTAPLDRLARAADAALVPADPSGADAEVDGGLRALASDQRIPAEVAAVAAHLDAARSRLQQAAARQARSDRNAATLEAMAMRDELTGLLNRRGLRAFAAPALALGQRSGRPDALLYVDLDGFKAINDRHGHAAGDEALRRVAEALRTTVRACDLVARVGGDEFVVLAVGLTHPGEGGALAYRLRTTIAAENARAAAAGHAWAIALSIGVAERGHDDDLDGLLARADAAAYAAKRGRA